jgi:hypothetical protein
MKKMISVLIVMGLGIAGTTQAASGQAKGLTLSLNAGGVTNISNNFSGSGALMTIGGRADVRLGKSFLVSPELQAFFCPLNPSCGIFNPALTLTWFSRGVFIGAGVAFPVFVGGGESEGLGASPKINLGFRDKHTDITIFVLLHYNRQPNNIVGASLGYVF